MNYFEIKTMGEDEFSCFNGLPTPCTQSPVFDVFNEVGMSPSVFVEKANRLFNEYNIKVPSDYPKNCSVTTKYYGETVVNTMDEFANCVASCILIKEQFDIDVSKIIRYELIEKNSRSGILHADSMAAVALYYLKNNASVLIPKEQANQCNPDLLIDSLNCEIKVVDESDWTVDIDMSTGEGKKHSLSEDICYDIGMFIGKRDSGHKGIKQSDVIFADLSRKSFGFIENMLGIKRNGFPKLHKYRIIYFAKIISEFSSFYLDFDPYLWELIKTTEKKHRFGIFPAPKGAT